MNYYLDTEFHEYQKKPLFGKPIDTIELISIGIVCEEFETPVVVNKEGGGQERLKQSKEYYAICKDFDLKDAWNSFQWTTEKRDAGMTRVKVKEYWLRENVLKPIYFELLKLDNDDYNNIYTKQLGNYEYKIFKKLLNKYGKTREQIAEDIKEFVYGKSFKDNKGNPIIHDDNWIDGPPKFYAYYADYDWVVFCWLFGRMIDLPEGFPMYCKDLKQLLDSEYLPEQHRYVGVKNIEDWLDEVKRSPNYPKNLGEHNALADAHWNKQLHEFILKYNF